MIVWKNTIHSVHNGSKVLRRSQKQCILTMFFWSVTSNILRTLYHTYLMSAFGFEINQVESTHLLNWIKNINSNPHI